MDTEKITVRGSLSEKIETTKYGNITIGITIAADLINLTHKDITSEEFAQQGQIAGDKIQDVVENVFVAGRERIVEAYEIKKA